MLAMKELNSLKKLRLESLNPRLIKKLLKMVLLKFYTALDEGIEIFISRSQEC